MISHKHKFIFIHIPKTGGSSISKELGLFNNLERDVQDHTKLQQYERMQVDRIMSLRHAFHYLRNLNFEIFKEHFRNFTSPTLTTAQYAQYYKFCFVRNSWSRLHSWYKNVMRDPWQRKYFGVSDNCSFYDFMNNHLPSESFSQLSYIRSKNGRIEMDFIGRYEFLQRDYNVICDALGLANSELPHLLRSNDQTSYTTAYDEKTKDLVYRQYYDEIEYFKFEFGE